MKVVVIIQARMGSTRLPGKILMPFAGKPDIEHVVERALKIPRVNSVVVATTVEPEDDPLVKFLEEKAWPYFRGSENDVLERYYHAAVENQADVIVRITSDCPMISPGLSGKVISEFINSQERWDYCSNVPDEHRTFPRGLDTEVFSFVALERSFKEAVNFSDREHVTPYIRRETPKDRMGEIISKIDYSKHRWTLDTPEDYQLLSLLIEHLYPQNPNYEWEDAIALIERHPEWAQINAHIEQKKV